MTIVVGYISSPEGQAALDAAAAEARLRNADLVIVHSLHGGGRGEGEQVLAYREELEAIQHRLIGEGVRVQVREMVRGQSPAQDVIDIAEREQASLIIIGLRKRTPVGKLLLGSNAQDILLAAPCPVLAVKSVSPAP